jgi:MFS family permease
MMSRNYGRRPLAGLVTVRALGELGSSAMLPFIVIWAHRDAGLGGAAAGVLFIMQAAGEFGAGLAGGALADRFGHRRLLLLSAAGMAMSYGLLAIATVPAAAIALFLLAGIFESAFHPTIGALVGDMYGEEQLLHAFGVVRVGANAGRVAGPLIGAAAAVVSLPLVFAAAGGLLAGALLAGLALIPRDAPGQPGNEHGDPEPEIPPGTLRALLTDRRLAVLVLAGGLLAITFTWWEADGLVLLRQQHPLGTTAYAALFTIAAAAIVAFQIPVTRRTARMPTGRAMLTGAVLQGAGLTALVFARYGYAVLVIAVLLMAAGEMIYAPTVSAFVTTRAGRHRRASYQAALSITEDIGTAIGPISGLALATATSAAILWAAGATLSALAGTATNLAAAGPPGQPRRPGPAPSQPGTRAGQPVRSELGPEGPATGQGRQRR